MRIVNNFKNKKRIRITCRISYGRQLPICNDKTVHCGMRQDLNSCFVIRNGLNFRFMQNGAP